MAWTATVTKKSRDISNMNIIAEISFTDGVTTLVDRIAAVDLSDAAIAEHVRRRITNVLEPGDAALAAITVGDVTPAAAPDETKQEAIRAAQVAFQKAAQAAQVKALNDPSAAQAYADLVAAQDALEAP